MTELLAPAGSVEALRCAINAGCDAVYIGGKMFGARAYADNPDSEELLGAIDHCHIFGKKIYLTVNTLLKNEELTNNLFNFLKPCYEEGLDGVIVSDIGVMKAISLWFPGLPIHVSTQASITSAEGAIAISKLIKGITRVVPSRELSLCEIQRLKNESGLETEVFVHGALCYSYSGQCLFSSFAGGRSGNRGRCAQPCRLKYDTGDRSSYILSCKDLCMLNNIGMLCRAGVDSFKIEGRMKSPVYVASTVSVYRKYIDLFTEYGDDYEEYLEKHNNETENDISLLKEIYNRGGFSDGFLKSHNSSSMIYDIKPSHTGVLVGSVRKVSGREAEIIFTQSVNGGDVLEIRDDSGNSVYEFTIGKVTASELNIKALYKILVSKGSKAAVGMSVYRTRNELVIEKITDQYINTNIKRTVNLKFVSKAGSPMILTASCGETGVSVNGQIPEPAQSAEADALNIAKHLKKSGDNPFVSNNPEVSTEKGLFIRVSDINNMRRDVYSLLYDAIIDKEKRICPSEMIIKYCGTPDDNTKHYTSVLVGNKEQFTAVATGTTVKRIYLPFNDIRNIIEELGFFKEWGKKLACEGRELFIALPYICRSETFKALKASGMINCLSPICGFLVRNKEELMLFCDNDTSEEALPKVTSSKSRIILDHTMQIFNKLSSDIYGHDFTYSTELNMNDLKLFNPTQNAELIVYSRVPLMLSAHCVYKNSGKKCTRFDTSNKEKMLSITDEKGHSFPVVRQCDTCTNIIYNSDIMNITGYADELEEIKHVGRRYEFMTESTDEILQILSGRLPRKKYTSGHFRRGVL